MQTKKCQSCSSELNKDAFICPKCGAKYKAPKIARIAFWVSQIFGYLNLLLGMMTSCAGGVARGFGEMGMGAGDSHGAEGAGTLMFWLAIPLIVSGFMIKNGKQLGWKIATGATVLSLFGVPFAGMDALILSSVPYGIVAFLGFKFYKTQ